MTLSANLSERQLGRLSPESLADLQRQFEAVHAALQIPPAQHFLPADRQDGNCTGPSDSGVARVAYVALWPGVTIHCVRYMGSFYVCKSDLDNVVLALALSCAPGLPPETESEMTRANTANLRKFHYLAVRSSQEVRLSIAFAFFSIQKA